MAFTMIHVKNAVLDTECRMFHQMSLKHVTNVLAFVVSSNITVKIMALFTILMMNVVRLMGYHLFLQISPISATCVPLDHQARLAELGNQ